MLSVVSEKSEGFLFLKVNSEYNRRGVRGREEEPWRFRIA